MYIKYEDIKNYFNEKDIQMQEFTETVTESIIETAEKEVKIDLSFIFSQEKLDEWDSLDCPVPVQQLTIFKTLDIIDRRLESPIDVKAVNVNWENRYKVLLESIFTCRVRVYDINVNPNSVLNKLTGIRDGNVKVSVDNGYDAIS